MDRKHELAVQAQEKMHQLKQWGFVTVYTDGSAQWVPTVGWIGGYGCYEPREGCRHASYLTPQLRQSINQAELQAIIDVVDR